MGKTLEATVWNNSGEGWGLRIRKSSSSWFVGRKSVNVSLQGKVVAFPITESFWRTCPEIRGGAIREWLENLGVTKANKNEYDVHLEASEGGTLKASLFKRERS